MFQQTMRVASRNEHDGPAAEGSTTPSTMVQIVLAPANSPGGHHFPLPVMTAAQAQGWEHGAEVLVTFEVQS